MFIGIKKKKGSAIVNIFYILMIINLISICVYRIVHNNLLRTSIKYKYEDLFNQEYIESSISKVNLYLKNNKINLEEAKGKRERINIDENIYIIYDYRKDSFIMVDTSQKMLEVNLGYKIRDDNWCLVPYQKKYII